MIINKPFKAIQINGRRWFQKLYGNTYNTVEIDIYNEDGSVDSVKLGFEYGYGEDCFRRAFQYLHESGRISLSLGAHGGLIQPDWTTRAENKIECNVFDVKRKRDL